MNETLNVLETRRSVRGFDPERMPSDELIEQVVRAGEYAPTGRGMQSPRMVVVTNKAVRDKLSQLNAEVMGVESDPFYGAPAIIIVLTKTFTPTYLYDGSLAMVNMMLAAHSLGLGSCWIHRARQEFETDTWKEWLQSLGIEGEYEGIGHLALGYVDGQLPTARPRKDGRVFWVK